MSAIQNFPITLQPLIEQGFHTAEFKQGVVDKTLYQSCSERVEITANDIKLKRVKRRLGFRKIDILAYAPALHVDEYRIEPPEHVEEYRIEPQHHSDTPHYRTPDIAGNIRPSLFLSDAYEIGNQAAITLDNHRRAVLYSAYTSGNTHLVLSLQDGHSHQYVYVDDIRGFQTVYHDGVRQSVSEKYPMAVRINQSIYECVRAFSDDVNVSTAFLGISGTLVFSQPILSSDLLVGMSAIASTGSSVIRSGVKKSPCHLGASDVITVNLLMRAVRVLKMRGVPEISGLYNCYLDETSLGQLMRDPDFKDLFQKEITSEQILKSDTSCAFLGLRFIMSSVSEEIDHPMLKGATIHTVFICGAGALLEGACKDITAGDTTTEDAIIDVVDGITLTTRALDIVPGKAIKQSWDWHGFITAPSDTTTNPQLKPDPRNAEFKHAVVIEHTAMRVRINTFSFTTSKT